MLYLKTQEGPGLTEDKVFLSTSPGTFTQPQLLFQCYPLYREIPGKGWGPWEGKGFRLRFWDLQVDSWCKTAVHVRPPFPVHEDTARLIHFQGTRESKAKATGTSHLLLQTGSSHQPWKGANLRWLSLRWWDGPGRPKTKNWTLRGQHVL